MKKFELLRSILNAVIITFFVKTFLYQVFEIPSSSMQPNLIFGDIVIIKKYSYNYSNSSTTTSLNNFYLSKKNLKINNSRRGDVVVFFQYSKGNKYFIKRLIAISGDIIQIKKGRTIINSVEVLRKCISHTKSRKLIYQEFLPGNTFYTIQNLQQMSCAAFPDTTFYYTVPRGHYFLMGDNRNNSVDSRFLESIGYINKSMLVGKAVIIFYNKNYSITRIFRLVL